MSGIAPADILIGRPVGMAARVAGTHVHHTGEPAQGIFHAPETSARQHGHLRMAHLFVQGQAQLFLVAARGRETHGQGIDAMAGVLGRQALALKHMPQMRAAVIANDLHPAAVGIGLAAHHARQGIVEGRPAAPGIELVRRTVQGHAALAAQIGPGGRILFVFTGPRGFRGLAEDDVRLAGRQGRHGGIAAGNDSETAVIHGGFLP